VRQELDARSIPALRAGERVIGSALAAPAHDRPADRPPGGDAAFDRWRRLRRFGLGASASSM